MKVICGELFAAKGRKGRKLGAEEGNDGLVLAELEGDKLSMLTCLRWAGDNWVVY